MRSASPIIPPDSPLQRTLPGGNRKFLFTVSAILALHLILLVSVLIQGCKRQDQAGTVPQDNSLNALEPLSDTADTPPAGTTPRVEAPPETTLPPAQSTAVNPLALPGGSPTPPAVTTTPDIQPSAPEPVTPSSMAASQPARPLPPARTVTYEVKRGDTLTRIARNHGTTPKAIREANGLKTDRILAGQKLKVPEATSPTPGSLPR
ncbi:MAG: LysM peptidoglycan-binding domain-containing protein [Verrucomicrobiia bacterium]